MRWRRLKSRYVDGTIQHDMHGQRIAEHGVSWTSLLAQTDQSRVRTNMLWLVGFFVLALVVGGLLASLVRRRMDRRRDDRRPAFSLDELRQWRDDGKLTEEQYKALRQKIISTLSSGGGQAD